MKAATQTQSKGAVARLVAVLLALISAIILMGVIDLFTLPGWVDQQYEWEVPLEANWGALFTFFVAGAYVWVALFPRAPWPAFLQLTICASALLISAGAGGDWRPMAVAALGLPLWLPYALEAFTQSRAGVLGSITQGIEHWPVQGAVGVAIVLGSVAMALWRDGRPLLRVAISLFAVYIGMAELAYPDRAGAMGNLVWGIGVTLWGLLVALVAVPPPRRQARSTTLPRGMKPTPNSRDERGRVDATQGLRPAADEWA